MTNADVAKLSVQLDLQGNFTSAIGAAEKQLGGFQTTVGKASGALGHASNQLKNLATVGLAALGVGIFTVTGFFEKGISKASEFGFAIEKLQGLTNDSADSLSQLIAVTDNYGISAERLTKVVGFTEKTLGNIATTAGAAETFTKKFGFAITDAQGKVLPFNTILEKAADFYNSSADQSTKAALAAQLFGRNYTDLVPILKLGAQGIRDAEQAAKDLGITLTGQNVEDLKRFREATRTLGDTMTGLQLQIGLVLVPTITDLAKTISTFVSSHRTDIVTFFKNALQAAKDAGKVIGGLVSTVSGFWSSFPPELRDLLTKGLIADRTVKFLFGFSPIGTAASSIFGSFLARGSSPANPLFVSGAGIGGVGGTAIGIGAIVPVIAAVVAYLAYAKENVPEGTYGSNAPGSATNRYGYVPGSRPTTQRTGDRWMDGVTRLTSTMDAGDKSWRDNTAALAANTAALWGTSSLSGRLAHSVAPGSKVNKLLTDALRIATGDESNDKKLAELKVIKDKLVAGDHHQSYFLTRLIAEIPKTGAKVTVITNVKVGNANTVRISSTNSTSATGYSTGTFIKS